MNFDQMMFMKDAMEDIFAIRGFAEYNFTDESITISLPIKKDVFGLAGKSMIKLVNYLKLYGYEEWIMKVFKTRIEFIFESTKNKEKSKVSTS